MDSYALNKSSKNNNRNHQYNKYTGSYRNNPYVNRNKNYNKTNKNSTNTTKLSKQELLVFQCIVSSLLFIIILLFRYLPFNSIQTLRLQLKNSISYNLTIEKIQSDITSLFMSNASNSDISNEILPELDIIPVDNTIINEETTINEYVDFRIDEDILTDMHIIYENKTNQ